MRRDAFTTTPEAAAEHNRLTTPAYDDRYDHWDDDERYVRNSWPIDQLRAVFGAMTRPMRCAHGMCRTSLDDKAWVECPHGLAFCEACTWEEACGECATKAGAA